ncbi:hypothetical protein [Aliidongia dinghuensis]|nr:hypothetical protein [Aliidongia dinghuensis]
MKYAALDFDAGPSSRSISRSPVRTRRRRVSPARSAKKMRGYTPSLAERADGLLSGILFLALMALAVLAEAVGVAQLLLG